MVSNRNMAVSFSRRLTGEAEELDLDGERYVQMIPGERLEPTEKYLRGFIAAANLRHFEPQSTIIFGGESCDSIFLLLRGWSLYT